MKKYSKSVIRRLFYSLEDSGEKLVWIPDTAEHNAVLNNFYAYIKKHCDEHFFELETKANEMSLHAEEQGFVKGFTYAMELFLEASKKEKTDK